MCVAFFCFFFF